MANQREHLILLLANVHIRQFPKSDQQPKVSNIRQIYIADGLDKAFIYIYTHI